MKVMTVLGTRPEIIRLSLIIKELDKYCHHVLVHTGQNFDENLNSIFFRDLDLRKPDYYLGIRGNTFGEQIGKIIIEVEKIILHEKPDRMLILGDTNSGLVTIIANRMGIPVFHMEAGNRCFDNRVPEEVNRRIIDHSSTVLLPYTHRSKENLLNEGIPINNIYVIGNPIYEVINHYSDRIDCSDILDKLSIVSNNYFLTTMHRQENVDDVNRVKHLLSGLEQLGNEYSIPVICSLHPRTKGKIKQFDLAKESKNIRFCEPFGFFDFVALEKNARCVISDSGTVQEECSIFKVPNITIRDVTERPETIESGSNILASVSPELIMSSVEIVLNGKLDWNTPAEYLETNVSSKVIKIILGFILN